MSCSMENRSPPEKAFPYVSNCPNSDRMSSGHEETYVPVIDLARLRQGDEERTLVIKEIREACSKLGFFQIVNHGIPQAILDEAISSAFEFFNLPGEEKAKFMSSDVHEPVRYAKSFRNEVDKVDFWRVFLKHYAHPLNDWVHLWPSNPPTYREKMGKYSTEVQKLTLKLMGIITESLGLGSNYLGKKMDEGLQVMAVNCYPPCPNPEVSLGMPPHTDYTCLTVVLQSSPGLQVLVQNEEDNRGACWQMVPEVHGSLEIHVGDHLQVLSNGIYKGVVHRAVLNEEKTTRVSIASLHSLGMDDKMETAKELVDEQRPKGYKESSFRDFLNFLSDYNPTDGKSYIDTLKI